MSSRSRRRNSRSTTCAPRSSGAAKPPISSLRCGSRRRCNRCGSTGPHPRRAGLVRRRPHRRERAPASSRPRSTRGRSPTRPCSTPGAASPRAWIRPQQALPIAREIDDPALLTRALTACGTPATATTPRWPGRTSPRRSAWRGHRRPVEAEPDPRLAGARCDRRRVIRRGARGRPKKDAISPRRSVIGSTRVVALVPRVGAVDAGRSRRSRRTIPRVCRRGRGSSRSDLEGATAYTGLGMSSRTG